MGRSNGLSVVQAFADAKDAGTSSRTMPTTRRNEARPFTIHRLTPTARGMTAFAEFTV
jgi:hypothetical protein